MFRKKDDENTLWFGASMKSFTTLDVALFKLSVFTFALMVVSAWGTFANWVLSTQWYFFLIAWILFSIKPTMEVWKKE